MCAGFGNTSFVGIPLIQAMYGEEGLKTVMLVDQPGFVALSTGRNFSCQFLFWKQRFSTQTSF